MKDSALMDVLDGSGNILHQGGDLQLAPFDFFLAQSIQSKPVFLEVSVKISPADQGHDEVQAISKPLLTRTVGSC